MKTMNIPFPSLLIFCSIGFSLLFAMPGVMEIAKRKKEKDKLFSFFKYSGKFFIIPSMGYIIGAFVNLFYFLTEDTQVGMYAFWIIVITTAIVLAFIPLSFTFLFIKEALEKMVEKALIGVIKRWNNPTLHNLL